MESIRVRFTGGYINPWMLSHYISKFSTLMTRLDICLQIPQVLALNINPQKIYLVKGSRNLWDEPLKPDFITLKVPLLRRSEDLYQDMEHIFYYTCHLE